ncbi:hypothetical protein J5X84_37045 [Streptosporangiaceae bacterium NEAU-GS5]|nr:hypothetical protein [Streptosporangiaceae bacterium NEAU-GS5]
MAYTPDPSHARPEGAKDATVEGVGVLTDALETIERARGHLYAFHQLTGQADLALDRAVELLREAGHAEMADRLVSELVGRDVIPGQWTFQIVEAYDEGYYAVFRALERDARNTLLGGRRHVYEAEMKRDRQP